MTARTLITAAIAATITTGTVASLSTTAGAGEFYDRNLTAIWVDIKAYDDEGLWEACRRVYQRDVYAVRHGKHGQVRCKIDHSRVYDYGERYQNFN